MKRVVLILLTALFVLCGCGGDGEEGASEKSTVSAEEYALISQAVQAFNEEDRREVSVILSLTKGEENAFFTQGGYAYDRGDPIAMSGKTTQVYGDGGSTSEVFYKAGAYYYSGKDGKFYESFDRQLFLEQYLCTNITLCPMESVSGYRKAETSAGTKYVLNGVEEKFFKLLFDESLFYYSGLKKPIEEKTEYTDGEFTVVTDGEGDLVSFSVKCKAVLYDTAPYYPTGYTEGEQKHVLELSYELSVKALGDKVEIVVPDTKEYTFLG